MASPTDPSQSDPARNVNSWFLEELYQQYQHDKRSVDPSWKQEFENGYNGGAAKQANGTPDVTALSHAPAQAPVKQAPAVDVGASDQLTPLRGTAGRIATNMELSLTVPTATSQRVIPVKLIDENRQLINQHRSMLGLSKISYTHLIGYAIVRALQKTPAVNHAFAEVEGQPYRVVRNEINLGIAIDVAGKDGTRSLLVPNIKNAGAMDFAKYLAAFDDLVKRGRNNTLKVEDYKGTSISLTNPGTVGTFGSNPRLMPGQGAIIATGAIDYPAEFQGVSQEMKAALGISKVMAVSCTYDHRVIQGAESGMFLGTLQSLLEGGDRFYDEIFASLKLPYQPLRFQAGSPAAMPEGLPVLAQGSSEMAKNAAVLQMINLYRVRGHLIADLDPLGGEPGHHPELDPANYGLTVWDLDRDFLTGTLGDAMGRGTPMPSAKLRDILDTLRKAYCGKIGCEYMNIQNPEEKRWLQLRIEPDSGGKAVDAVTKRRILHGLIEGEMFEQFLHTRYMGHKRFSLEGAETTIPILNEILEMGAAQGAHEIVIGMAHRGRLTVLANVVGKPLDQLFSEFEGNIDPHSTQGSGDVKYHLGASAVRNTSTGREIVASLSPNPSHLEAVNPVVEGIARRKQDRLGDTERKRVIPLLVHGDAAFAGQGVVAETLNLSQLDGYRTGGTIHLIINNQIGFTTQPEAGRSTPYATDIARTVQAPIFHVNGDDPEAAILVTRAAFDYRQRFNKDVVIDLICYRRHGHNETDDPSYTQPTLYKKIKDHASPTVQYTARVLREGVVSQAEVEAFRKEFGARLNAGQELAKSESAAYQVQEMSDVSHEEIAAYCPATGVSMETLRRVVDTVTTVPEGFHLHPKLISFVDKRNETLEKGGPVDWAFAETLAFGSLLLEGTPVRLSGQDSGRGTFSQRHIIFTDSETGNDYIPLQHLSADQGTFEVYNSSLSEYAVLGFEFGYSVADPLSLVIWEAQFGDFVNGAQILIDQFLAAAKTKWGQPSGLVLFLPHGYEGQGPEHSSARIERFLQLCAEENMQIVNCTTPAQHFHVLRRQMCGGPDRRGVRKPLVCFTPKSLLRHAKAVSTLHEMASGGFREIIGDTSGIDASRVTRVAFCCGKVYYDLAAYRDPKQLQNVALVRVEQLYPFAADQAQDVLARYPATAEVVWVQEEPQNMGGWRHIREQFLTMFEGSRRSIRYIGRPESASPATGSLKRHQAEQAHIIEQTFAAGNGAIVAAPAKKAKAPARRKK